MIRVKVVRYLTIYISVFGKFLLSIFSILLSIFKTTKFDFRLEFAKKKNQVKLTRKVHQRYIRGTSKVHICRTWSVL